ncbi:MAG: PSP1 domain-containing protein [bacterium]
MGCSGCDLRRIDGGKGNYSENSCGKLSTHDWLSKLPETFNDLGIVELRFKNTRKQFFKNSHNLEIKRGDIVVVGADRGYDMGVVSLTGHMAYLQFKKKISNQNKHMLQSILRIANNGDIDLWRKAQSFEENALTKARHVAREHNMNMKIGDVEYQADMSKIIFYYISDERVDFRELIRVYAKMFRARIEMKQIGARQEAGLIGGIGSCGRELCCSSWKTNLRSVSSDAIRYQELPSNARKLAGQCGKLKCCLMYELEAYLDARKNFPSQLLELETEQGIAYHHKVDVLKNIIWYSYNKDIPVNLIPLSIDDVKRIIQLNKKGILVKSLSEDDKYKTFSKKTIIENNVSHGEIRREPKKKKR